MKVILYDDDEDTTSGYWGFDTEEHVVLFSRSDLEEMSEQAWHWTKWDEDPMQYAEKHTILFPYEFLT